VTGATAEKKLTGNTDFTYQNDTMEFRVLLDSMMDGNHYSDIVGRMTKTGDVSKQFAPGDNITAVIKAEFSLGSISIKNGDTGTQVKTNSLFGDGSTKDSLHISSLRHLNNLRSSIYTYSGEGLQIVQTASIDFTEDDYSWVKDTATNLGRYSNSAVSPLKSFQPVSNTSLDSKTDFDGQGNAIRNMVISGEGMTETGLFSAIKGWKIQNVNLIDPTLKNTKDTVGTLAGSMTNCTVDACGVYLSTKDEDGSYYVYQTATDSIQFSNRMEERRSAGTVSGNRSVGGLVGKATGTKFTSCFAAIDVSGSSEIGGFAGTLSGGSIQNSYSSGRVTASGSSAGGIAGSASAVSADSSYSTSTVTAPSKAGGFVGTVSGGSCSSCVSYGSVSKSDGSFDTTSSGGFAGSGSATFSSCQYLRQKGFNETYRTPAGVSAQDYTTLALPDGETKLGADPYDVSLYAKEGSVFPFRTLTGQTTHHGDWPIETTILAALVYYERYRDGSYGLYAMTGLSAGEDSQTAANWELNTLKQLPCQEDGYALMTIYQLTSFKCDLNKNRGGGSYNITVKKTDDQNNSIRLATADELTFTNQTTKTQFKAKDLNLYRLPYDLQQTQRDKTATFYDKLVITEAYTSEQNKASVLSGYGFYYNPHFAKNAINSDPKSVNNDAIYPAEPTKNNDQYIIVRTARQLHNLGIYSYYWNTANNGTGSAFQFRQENDIDFRYYATSYCGNASFNLMDTSYDNANRNRPIGRPGEQEFKDYQNVTRKPSNFKNQYDGNFYKIIDFRTETYAGSDNYQFTGLFGEIQNAVIKNVVMVASNPSGASGYVKSHYNQSKLAGVGALVGLVYRGAANDITVVQNCAVSGYTVMYDGTKQNAVGGLAGYNMGTIQSCTAVSKLVESVPSASVYADVGGLVGVNMYQISDCYSGGKLNIGGKEIEDSSIGGICGTLRSLWTSLKGKNVMSASVSDSYSYCSTTEVSGIVYYGAAGAFSSKKTPAGYDYTYCSGQTVSNCWYLINTTVSTVSGLEGGDDKTYKQLQKRISEPFGTADYSYPWGGQAGQYPFPAIVKNRDQKFVHYGNWPMQTIAGGVVVYYEKYSDSTYGFCYVSPDDTADNSIVDTRKDSLAIQEAGYGYLATDNRALRTSLEVACGNSTYKNNNGTWNYETVASGSAQTVTQTALTVNGTSSNSNGNNTMVRVQLKFNTLIKFPADVIAAMTPGAGTDSADTEMVVSAYGYQKAKQPFDPEISSDNSYYRYDLFTNAGFAAAISAQANTLGVAQSFELRTQGDLAEISTLTAAMPTARISYSQTHDIAVSSAQAGLLNLGQYSTFTVPADKSYTITNLQQPLFRLNEGTVQNLTLKDSQITASDSAAAFAIQNTGSIAGCKVQNLSILGTGTNAGFVVSNSGEIQNCSADGSVEGEAVSGFAAENLAGSVITGCTADMAKLSGKEASGFVGQNLGSISGSSVKLTALSAEETASGFAGANAGSGTIDNGQVSMGTIRSETGTAAGFVAENGGRAQVTNSSVSGGTVSSVSGSAYGFAGQNGTLSGYSAVISGCGVSAVTVTSGGGNAAGFLGSQNGQSCAFGNTVSNVTVSAQADAAGFILSNGSSVGDSLSGCAVSGGSVLSNAASAAGFVLQNSSAITGCGVQSANISAPNGRASGFADTNEYAGTIRGNSYVSDSTVNGRQAAGFVAVNEGTITDGRVSNTQSVYAMTVTGTDAAVGFVLSNSGSIYESSATASVSAAPGGLAAGFASTGGTLTNCSSSCLLAGKTMAGFAFSGTCTNCTWTSDTKNVTDNSGAVNPNKPLPDSSSSSSSSSQS
jgi:hypothetical protein